MIVPTFRRSLALTLSGVFKIQCYTNMVAGDNGEWDKLSICLDSLVKMPDELVDSEYDVVVLDEAGMLRRHFVLETMVPRWRRCFEVLRRIIVNAKKGILMQHKLTERDVEFFYVHERLHPV